MLAPKSQQNRATAFDTHSQSFILQVDIGLASILRVMDLVTDGENDATQDTSTRTVILYMRQSIQEWTKQKFWKKDFKKFEGVWSS